MDEIEPARVFLLARNIYYAMRFFDYLRDTKAELRHVTWPTRKDAINYTIIVLSVSIFTGLFLGLLDFLFAKGLARLIQ